MISIGTLAKELREKLGWTQRKTALRLDVTYAHLCNIENNKKQPSRELLDRYRQLWGIDLYVLAWCNNGDIDKLPPNVRQAAASLSTAWRIRIEHLIKEHSGRDG